MHIIAQILDRKWSLCICKYLFGGLGATYTVHLRLIGKLAVDFYWTFFGMCYGWGATSEYQLENGIFEGNGSVCSWRVFTQGHFIADFLLCNFRSKTVTLHFWAPSGDLESTYDVHLRHTGTRHLDWLDWLLIRVNWTFLYLVTGRVIDKRGLHLLSEPVENLVFLNRNK